MKSRLNLKKTMILFTLVPLTVGMLIFAVVSGILLTNSIESNIQEELKTASTALREYYEYDLINDNDLVDGFCEYDTEFIDKMAATGVDYTLFRENIRFMTSIKDVKTGKRIEGTEASPAVWNAVKSGSDYYSDDVVINGIDYYVYYLPLGTKDNVMGMAFSGKPCTQVVEAERRLYTYIVLFALILEVFFLILAWYLSKKISSPIQYIANDIEELSNGKTDIDITANSHIYETGMLIESAKRLSGILKDSISKIQNSANALKVSVNSTSELAKESSNSTTQITVAMDGLAKTTDTMANSVQEVNSNIINMGTMIDGIVESAEKLGLSSDKMAKAGNEANKCIKDMSDSSKKSFDAIESITDKIALTNQSVKKIDEMVNLITDIATQTNLLSLNASIEASRAGEAGKGFGVVATEIKNLAEQSGNSAEKIMTVVEEISMQSSECVEQSKEVRKSIEEEQNLLNITKEKFEILGEEIEASVAEIRHVTDATNQLNSAKDTITSAVSDLSAISEETAATNEEVTSSIMDIAKNVQDVSDGSDHMNTLANELEEAVEYFK